MSSRRRSAAVPPPVPVYQLYGEGQPWLTPDLVHVESIASRSRLHQWEIRPHRHHGLFQLLWLQQGSAEVQLDDRSDRLSSGSVLLLPQHCVHGFHFSQNARGVVVTLAYAFLARLHGGLGDRLAAMASPQTLQLADGLHQAEIEALLTALLREYGGQGEHRHLLLESLLVSVLSWLRREPAAQDGLAASDRGRQYLSAFSVAIERDHAAIGRLENGPGITSGPEGGVDQRVPGLELAHVRERRGRGGDVSQLEKRVQRFPVELAGCQAGRVQVLGPRAHRLGGAGEAVHQ